MLVMECLRSTFPLLLDDERSAVRLKPALLTSLIVLATTTTGLLLMFLAEDIHQHRAGKVLRALHGGPAATAPV
jgi:hypothetical protein